MSSPDESGDSTKLTKCVSCIKTNWLTLATFGGVLAGGLFGIILKFTVGSFTPRQVLYIGFLGDLFLRILKSLIIPLIMASIISAINSIDLSLSSRIAARAVIFYLTTVFAAVCLGISLVVIIRPGVGQSEDNMEERVKINTKSTSVDTLLDLIRNLFPPNIVQAFTAQSRTVLKPPSNNPNETDMYKWSIGSEFYPTTNIIGLVIVSLVLGVALVQLGQETETITNCFHNLMRLAMKITSWVIKLSPVGIFFLVTAKVAEMDDFVLVMQQIGWYAATVLIGLLVQSVAILPLLYFLLTRKNPYVFIGNIAQALFTAFGTASSSATLPVTMRCIEEYNGVDPRVSRFALPIGAVINMDGTALYEAVAAIFIAQVRNVEMGFGSYVLISITATAASIGAAGIPQAGLVTMVMVLDTVGLPAEDISLIFALDWLLDRFRTTVNVLGDSIGAGIVFYLSQKDLGLLPD